MNSTSTLVLKQPANLSQLFNQFNNITENHTNRDPDNVVKCRYYDIEEIQTLNIPNKSKSLSMFHINTCSLSKDFDDLEYLLKTTNMNFDIVAVSESRMTNIGYPTLTLIIMPLNSALLNPQQEDLLSMLQTI